MIHVKPVVSDEQEANLRKLASYLMYTVAELERGSFNMETFSSEGYTPADWHHILTLKSVNPRECGTAACAAGYGPLAGIMPNREDKGWYSYTLRAFVTDYNPVHDEEGYEIAGEAHLANEFLFSGEWAGVDNSPKGAAQRIIYILTHGVPVFFVEREHGRYADAVKVYSDIEVPQL